GGAARLPEAPAVDRACGVRVPAGREAAGRTMNEAMNPLAAAMRSFVMTGFGEPLREHRGPRPEPAGSEVVLKVDACGVCHSDLHIWEGFFDLGGGRQLDIRAGIGLPRALGHEIAGTVIAVGPEVHEVRPGDRRVVFPWI